MQDHLRAVPESSNGDPPEKRSRARSRARTSKPLPTDRMKFDLQVRALRAIVVESSNGQRAVGAEDIAPRLSVATVTAGLNNAFFAEAGLLTKEGKGRYRPASA